MITKIVFGLVALLFVIGSIIFIVEMCRCEDGYEDSKGFHVGKEPPPKD
jgi:hypothetical protein